MEDADGVVHWLGLMLAVRLGVRVRVGVRVGVSLPEPDCEALPVAVPDSDDDGEGD